MSYCKFNSNCDLHLFVSSYGGFQIQVKGDTPEEKMDYHVDTREEVLSELEKLKKRGFKFPDELFVKIEDEMLNGEPEPTWSVKF